MLSMRGAWDSKRGGPNLSIPLCGDYIVTCPHEHRIGMLCMRGASDCSWRVPNLFIPLCGPL